MFGKKESLDKHMENHIQAEVFNCNKCDQQYRNKKDLSEHLQTHSFNGENCDLKFESQKSLTNHKLKHTPEGDLFNCDKCNEVFQSKGDIIKHLGVHNEESDIKCSKCEKVYKNMSKLRRHDWRSHREIDCNICGIKLRNRGEISTHRRMEHQMYRTAKCRFYPNCIDAEECFFQHDEKSNNKDEESGNKKSKFC